MKTIKFKYLISLIVMLAITIVSIIFPEKYHMMIPCLFGIFSLTSLLLLIGDRYTYVVTDNGGKPIRKFDNEKDAIEFADNQARNVRILMLHIKNKL